MLSLVISCPLLPGFSTKEAPFGCSCRHKKSLNHHQPEHKTIFILAPTFSSVTIILVCLASHTLMLLRLQWCYSGVWRYQLSTWHWWWLLRCWCCCWELRMFFLVYCLSLSLVYLCLFWCWIWRAWRGLVARPRPDHDVYIDVKGGFEVDVDVDADIEF